MAIAIDLGASRDISSKTSGGTLTLPSLGTSNVGGIIFASIAMDNLSSTTPTVTALTKPAGETNNWTIYNANASTASAAGGIKMAHAWIRTTTSWSGHAVVVTLSANVTAKVAQTFGVLPNDLPTVITVGTPAGGGNLHESSAVGTGAAGATVGPTGVGTFPAGSFLVLFEAMESAVGPTGASGTGGGGSWIVPGTWSVATSGGGSASNIYQKVAYKVTNTAATDLTTTLSAQSSDVGLVQFVIFAAAAEVAGGGWGIPI